MSTDDALQFKVQMIDRLTTAESIVNANHSPETVMRGSLTTTVGHSMKHSNSDLNLR